MELAVLLHKCLSGVDPKDKVACESVKLGGENKNNQPTDPQGKMEVEHTEVHCRG